MNILQSGVRKIKQYTFIMEDLLGKGATGEVYFGQDMNNGKKVAIKIIEMKNIDNEVVQYLLNNQKKALSALKHHNIVNTLDIIQQNQYCYIVTEFCNSGTLQELIKSRGKLSEKQALNYFRQILTGYKLCAESGIIHRDLKPSNILIHQNVPKISDFGYCEIAGIPKPKAFYNVGSPSYMAPEAYVRNMYGIKSDIWALGVILYQMLMGKTFDEGMKLMEAIYKIKKDGLSYDSNVSILCKSIIEDCLNLDPVKRIDLPELIKKIQVNTEKSPQKIQMHISLNNQVKNFNHPQTTTVHRVFASNLSHETSKISPTLMLQQKTNDSIINGRKISLNQNLTKSIDFSYHSNQNHNRNTHNQVYKNQRIHSNQTKTIIPDKLSINNYTQQIFPQNIQRTINYPISTKISQNLVRSVILDHGQNNIIPIMKKQENKILFNPTQMVQSIPNVKIQSFTPRTLSVNGVPQTKIINSPQRKIYFPETRKVNENPLNIHQIMMNRTSVRH